MLQEKIYSQDSLKEMIIIILLFMSNIIAECMLFIINLRNKFKPQIQSVQFFQEQKP